MFPWLMPPESARFWLKLQIAYELAVAERETGEKIPAEVTPAEAA